MDIINKRKLNDFLVNISKKLRLSYNLGKPKIVSIETINRCNLACAICYLGDGKMNRKASVMSFEKARSIVDQTFDCCETLYFALWGETFLPKNKDIFKIIRYARDKGIPQIIASTNGHFLNDANIKNILSCGITTLLISIDGMTQETYSRYRRKGNLEKVLKGVRQLVGERSSSNSAMNITLQFIVFRHNEHEMEEFRKFSESLGVGCSFKAPYVDDVTQAGEMLPKDDRYWRYYIEDGELKLKFFRNGGICYEPYDVLTIYADGEVAGCCFDYNLDYKFGNCFEKPIRAVWNGKAMRGFRRTLLRDRNSISFCRRNCGMF